MARTTLNHIGEKMRAFNAWVAGMLKVHGKTQKDLAQYLGMDVSNVSRRIHGSSEWTLKEFYEVEEFFGEEFRK